MFEYFEAEKTKKKAMTAAEKKAAKAAKDALEAPYTACLLDDRKEKVGNFRVEPPGLFRGRGDHPKKGALKVSWHLLSYFHLIVTAASTGFGLRTLQLTLERMRLFRSPMFLVHGRLFNMTTL